MSGVFGLGGVAPKLGAGVWIAPGACVIGDVTLEEGASVWFNCVLRGDDAQIQVGARTGVQPASSWVCLKMAEPRNGWLPV